MESIDGHRGICTRATTSKIRDTTMERCLGTMEVFTRESGTKGFSMDMER